MNYRKNNNYIYYKFVINQSVNNLLYLPVI